MRNEAPSTFRRLLPLYLACYAVWLGLAAIGVWIIFAARAAIFDIALALRLNPWQVRAVDQFSFVTLGLIWLVAILLIEDRLRKGVIKNRLWRRALRYFAIEVVVLCACYAVQILLT
jgi:hypothetical protein